MSDSKWFVRLDIEDVELFLEFRDDENTIYSKEKLISFIEEKTTMVL